MPVVEQGPHGPCTVPMPPMPGLQSNMAFQPDQPAPMPMHSFGNEVGCRPPIPVVEHGPHGPCTVPMPPMPGLQSNIAFQPDQPAPMPMHSFGNEVGCRPPMPVVEHGPHGPCTVPMPSMPGLQSNIAFQPDQTAPMPMHSFGNEVGCRAPMPVVEHGPHGPCTVPMPSMPGLQSNMAFQPDQPAPMPMHSFGNEVGCRPPMPVVEQGPHGPCTVPMPSMPGLQSNTAFQPGQPAPMLMHFGSTEVGGSPAMPVVEQGTHGPCPEPVPAMPGLQSSIAFQPDQPAPMLMHIGSSEVGSSPAMPVVEQGPHGPCPEPVPAMPMQSAFAEPCPSALEPEPLRQFQVHQWLAEHDVAITPASDPLAAPASSSGVTTVGDQVVLPASQSRKQTCASIIRPSEDLANSGLTLRPTLAHIPDCATLAATVEPNSGQCLWEWSRVADSLKLKDEKSFRFFSQNQEKHASEMIAAELTANQIQYRGWGDKGRGDHAVGSAALIMLLTLISNTKPYSAESKAKAIKLMVGLVQLSVAALEMVEGCPGICYGDGRYHERQLSVGATGIVQNFESLLLQHKGFTWAWGHLMVKGFCGHKIVSAQSHPCLWDILVLLAWAKNFPSTKKVWRYLGQFLWPKIIFLCSRIIDKYAQMKSLLPLEAAPLLKNKKGRNKRIPWQNKVLYLRKMRKIRHHRKIAATSHDDLLSSNCMLVVSAEEKLATGLYSRKIQEVYQNCYHFAVSWDPSSYDIETLVAIVFSAQCGKAAYLPIQNLRPVLKSEVDPSILALSAINKLTRVEGYNEIRALSHALKAINWPLEKFIFPKDLLWRPLQDFEERTWEDGRFWVVNTRTQEKKLQIPEAFQIKSSPMLVSLSDQGGINRAGLDYLVYKLSLAVHVQFDPYHRGWNDVKLALKSTKGDLYKCFLSFALLFNVNYGPSGSKEWFMRKQGLAQDIISSSSPHEEPFLSFLPWICRERNIPEPQSPEEREQIFNTILDMNNVRALGPVVKLMRWYSWWESEKYFEGECWATKFVMLWKTKNCSPTNVANYVKPEETLSIAKTGLTDKQELQQLKMKHGTWALAPLLVTPASMFQKDLIKFIAQPSWTHHADRSKYILTTDQVARYTVEKCKGGWVDELYDLVIQGLLSPEVLKKLYPHQATSAETKKKG